LSSRKHFLDLFSGLGGASEAFVMSENWSVLRIDNNPLFNQIPCTIIDDVTDIAKQVMPYPYEKVDCIWASPPCRDFSGGYNSPKSQASRSEMGMEAYEPDMSLLEAAIEIIDIVKPKYWVIENVVGSIRYFAEYLGEPRQIVGPYVLWGNFPFLDIDASKLKSKASKDVHSSNPLRANIKAKVDLEISTALKNALEQQHCILDY